MGSAISLGNKPLVNPDSIKISPPPRDGTSFDFTIPTAPTAEAGVASAKISFNVPEFAKYTIKSYPEGKTLTGITSSPVVMDGLTPGTSYKFSLINESMTSLVIANGSNVDPAKYESPLSNAVTPTAPTKPLPVPLNLTATKISNDKVKVSFEVPPDNGNKPKYYRVNVYYDTGSIQKCVSKRIDSNSPPGSRVEYTVTDLNPNVSFSGNAAKAKEITSNCIESFYGVTNTKLSPYIRNKNVYWLQ